MASTFAAVFEIVSFGAIIVLVVLGLGIIASMMGIFNFAQGEFVLLGAYVTYLAYAHGAPVWVGMIAAPFVVGALGFVLEALIIRRFYAAPIVAMLGTYALGLIIRESVRGLIGGFGNTFGVRSLSDIGQALKLTADTDKASRVAAYERANQGRAEVLEAAPEADAEGAEGVDAGAGGAE
jgi:branched-subunit amino acid ABC-type transport system permease component